MNKFEHQYLDTLERILTTGEKTDDRTGKGTRTIWGVSLDIPLQEGFPIVTTRATTARIAFEETWFFLRGETDTKKLEEKKIKIWKGNTSREFLDNRGLTFLPPGHMGKGYGFQWRNFGGDYTHTDTEDYIIDREGVDQLLNVIHGLKTNPDDRRHIITGWNPSQTSEMALPPCHLYQQYQVIGGKLHSGFVMRSWDFLYGGPFNIMGYALLNMAFSKLLGVEPGNLFAVGMNVHLYSDQISVAERQIERTPYELPKLSITKELNTIDDILSMEYTDIVFDTPYEAWPDFKDKPGMAV